MASTDTHKRKAYRVPDKPALEITDYTGWRSLLNPLWCYHGFRMAVVGLTCFGLIMVFSSSTVTMAALGKSPFLQLLNQGAFCLIGLVLGFVALMMPVTFWKRTGVLFVVGACLLQALTFTPLGIDVYGNKGWLNLGFTTIQPAEFMKFAMCIWLPSSLHACSKMYHKKGIKAYAAPLVLYAIGVALVMGPRHGHDSGLHRRRGLSDRRVPRQMDGSRRIGRGGYGRCIGGFQPEPLASYSGHIWRLLGR